MQRRTWDVASSKSEIFWYVSKDVDHLQRLAKSDASLHEQGFLFGWQGHQVSQRHLRPEHPDATGYPKGVIIQFLFVVEGRYVAAFVSGSKPFEVESLAANNNFQAFQHPFLVFDTVDLEPFNDVFDVPEQFGLVLVCLHLSKVAKIWKVGAPTLNHIVVVFEVLEQDTRFPDL